MKPMKHTMTAAIAFALSTGLAGAAFAQGAISPNSTGTPTPPAQVQSTNPNTMSQDSQSQANWGHQAQATPGTQSEATPSANAPGVQPMPNTNETNPSAMSGQNETNPSAMTGQNETNPSMSQIKEAQTQLKQDGLYNGPIDGRIGPETHAAIRKYQEQNGLQQSANLDQQTLQHLMNHAQKG